MVARSVSRAAVPAAVVEAPRRHCLLLPQQRRLLCAGQCAGDDAHATAGETPALLRSPKTESLR